MEDIFEAFFSLGLWVILLCIFIYILPSMLAQWLKRQKQDLIFLANILTGWTGAGWLVCFFWALMEKTEIKRHRFRCSECEKVLEVTEERSVANCECGQKYEVIFTHNVDDDGSIPPLKNADEHVDDNQ